MKTICIYHSIDLDGWMSVAIQQFSSQHVSCINKERFNPINFGIDYHKDGYVGAACFHYANGYLDCSKLAKQFGGGGHKEAAGFILDQEQFNNLIN